MRDETAHPASSLHCVCVTFYVPLQRHCLASLNKIVLEITTNSQVQIVFVSLPPKVVLKIMQSVKLAVVVLLIHLYSILYIAHAYAACKLVQWHLPSKGLQLCMSSGALSSMGKITIRQGDDVHGMILHNDNNAMLMRTYRSSRGVQESMRTSLSLRSSCPTPCTTATCRPDSAKSSYGWSRTIS
jgi:hypothetical protein